MNIHDEISIPGQEARYGNAPAWLTASPAWPAVKAQTGDGQLYLHQAMGLDLVEQGHNLMISTGTASGKSLVFQTPTLDHLVANPNATAIAIYPIKALARDQVIRWQSMAEAAGLDPAAINRIDGDVRDLTERRQVLQRTRLALMTPDVIQQWLMAYSEPLYGRGPLRHDLREVQNTQYNVRRFLSNLAFLILDEAHTYDGALGTHCLYLLHRLQQKRKELMAQFEPLRVIAASATIHNPAQHLETLTGLPFQVVDDRYNGSPRSELTVQHVVGREPHDEGWRDLQAAVREVISEDSNRSYIAFIDDRQLAERAAAGIEAARSITEDAIGVTFRNQLEARWAAWFDRRGIVWEYEPARFDGWTPDFRLDLGGAEFYAEVKPVSEFPMDAAQRILNAGCDADVLILGNGPRHAWRWRDSGWRSMDLTV